MKKSYDANIDLSKAQLIKMGYGVGSKINLQTKDNIYVNQETSVVPTISLEDVNASSEVKAFSKNNVYGAISEFYETGIGISSLWNPSSKDKFDSSLTPTISTFRIDYDAINVILKPGSYNSPDLRLK